MANGAPGAYNNITDTMVTIDAYRPFSTWIDWLVLNACRWLIEKIAPSPFVLPHATSGRNNTAHAHGEDDESEPVPRSVVQEEYTVGSDNAQTLVLASLSTSDWVEVDRQRAMIGYHSHVLSEVRYINTQDTTETIKWKIDCRRALDGDSAVAAEHAIVEASGTDHSGGMAWHTISGSLDGGGVTTDLTIDSPLERYEFRLYARTDGPVAVDVGVAYWHVWEEA